MILQGFINTAAPMIDASSSFKSWRKMPTVSLPKGNDDKDGPDSGS
jgi:hypothetical protein